VSVTIDEMLLSAAEVEIQAAGRTPTVSIVAYTGGLMVVPGWGPIAIELSGIDASAEQIGILADHDASLRGIVGHGRAAVAGGRLVVSGSITPTTDAARQIIDLAKAGFQFQASVGVAPTDYQRVRAGELFEVNGRAIKSPSSGFTLVKAGVLREVSIVALGADAATSVTIAAKLKENGSMSETQTAAPTADEIRADALTETNRIKAVRNACQGRFDDIEGKAIEEGWDLQRTELEVLRQCVEELGVARGRTAVVQRRSVHRHQHQGLVSIRQPGRHRDGRGVSTRQAIADGRVLRVRCRPQDARRNLACLFRLRGGPGRPPRGLQGEGPVCRRVDYQL